jgi:hypothetical protein
VSVAEIKAEAARLSAKELAELSRYFREQALRKDPARQEQLSRAVTSEDWLVQEEFEQRLSDSEGEA